MTESPISMFRSSPPPARRRSQLQRVSVPRQPPEGMGRLSERGRRVAPIRRQRTLNGVRLLDLTAPPIEAALAKGQEARKLARSTRMSSRPPGRDVAKAESGARE